MMLIRVTAASVAQSPARSSSQTSIFQPSGSSEPSRPAIRNAHHARPTRACASASCSAKRTPPSQEAEARAHSLATSCGLGLWPAHSTPRMQLRLHMAERGHTCRAGQRCKRKRRTVRASACLPSREPAGKAQPGGTAISARLAATAAAAAEEEEAPHRLTRPSMRLRPAETRLR